jgi:hypothetical protein
MQLNIARAVKDSFILKRIQSFYLSFAEGSLFYGSFFFKKLFLCGMEVKKYFSERRRKRELLFILLIAVVISYLYFRG